MKKIMLAFAVAAIAVTSQAAALKWSAANIYTMGTTTKSTGYSMVLFMTADTTATFQTTTVADVINAINNKTFSMGSGVDTITTSGLTTEVATLSQTFGGSTVEPNTLSGFAVIFNAADYGSATHYMITSEKSVTFTSDTGTKTLGFGSQASNTWAEIAPEPTSGLLMLLGMGALALRRRRA